jgi:hypothetical protein
MENKTRTVYLLNPTQSAKIVTATKYVLPQSLRIVHAFHDKINDLIRFKLNLALISSPQTHSLKEKLFHKQKGLCSICKGSVDYDKLLLNSAHISHIQPIKKGGKKYKISKLTLSPIWCHRQLKH